MTKPVGTINDFLNLLENFLTRFERTGRTTRTVSRIVAMLYERQELWETTAPQDRPTLDISRVWIWLVPNRRERERVSRLLWAATAIRHPDDGGLKWSVRAGSVDPIFSFPSVDVIICTFEGALHRTLGHNLGKMEIIDDEGEMLCAQILDLIRKWRARDPLILLRG